MQEGFEKFATPQKNLIKTIKAKWTSLVGAGGAS